MRVTHGCVRMYPEDIERLFGLVSVNTPVVIVDEPIKLGRLGERVFLSVHQSLDEGEEVGRADEAARHEIAGNRKEHRNRDKAQGVPSFQVWLGLAKYADAARDGALPASLTDVLCGGGFDALQ